MLILLISGVVLTYNQYKIDQEIDLFSQETSASAFSTESVIDTLQFIVNPSYEYEEFSCVESEDTKCDVLKRTVLSIDHKGMNSSPSTESFKRLPPNSSLNFMLETYTVERRTESCKTSYFVTVESFDTNLEPIGSSMEDDISASLELTLTPNEFYDLWRTGKAEELLLKYTSSPRPY